MTLLRIKIWWAAQSKPCGDVKNAAPETVRSGRIAYRNWWITYDPPPIPVRECDWQFWHEDYDGPEDNRSGFAASLEAAKEEIDFWHEEQNSSEVRKDFSEPERSGNEPATTGDRAIPTTCIEWMPGDEIPYRLSFQIKVF